VTTLLVHSIRSAALYFLAVCPKGSQEPDPALGEDVLGGEAAVALSANNDQYDLE
jgi:hypothetical protein